jgi:hypothetical protein
VASAEPLAAQQISAATARTASGGYVTGAATAGGAPSPDAVAIAAMESMYVPPKAGQPFSGKTVMTLTHIRGGSTVQFTTFSLVARYSSGRVYFENRRAVSEGEEPAARKFFTIIDPTARTRTMCYVETKTCRINAFRRLSFAESETREEAPRASASETVSLGTDVIDALTVEGTRETTTVAAGAYGNPEAMIVTKDRWHSPELDLDVSTVRTDPRMGTQTLKITEISRNEPDPEYFAIPADYKFLDDRPQGKK